jgi:hypothetical protein
VRILKLDINSDSPSAKSKGGRFVSAKQQTNHKTDEGEEKSNQR